MSLSSAQKSYLAGFLDGDGSIYVRLKPNPTYRYGFQVAAYIVLFQSAKSRTQFEKVCSLISLGSLRERKDGILEYTIGRQDDLKQFLAWVKPYVLLKRSQVELMEKILKAKALVKNKYDFEALMKLINSFEELNYSKKRIQRRLTP